MPRKLRAEIEQGAEQEVARELVGSGGHWIQEIGNGRYGVFDSAGVCHANVRGKDAAESAAMQLATTGKITRGETTK